MRAVIVSDFGEVNGGAAKVAVTSARGLADAGIPVTFVCAVQPLSPLLEHPGIAVHCLGFESVWGRANPITAARQGIWNEPACAALEKILEAVADDETVVHFHQWTKALSPSVLAAPLRYGLPSAVSLHDYFLVCPNGAYHRYPEDAPCRLVPMTGACLTTRCDRTSHLHKTVRILRQYATKRATDRAGASLSVISVSSFAERVIDGFIPRRHQRFVVPSPVSAVKTMPTDVARNQDFLFAGRLTTEKGVRIAAEAARDTNLPLTIAGDGPLLNELRQMEGAIRCTGWLDEAAVLKTIRDARALLFPSTWYETGGLVVLEALAQGVPVIVSRNTAAADYVSDGVNGYVIDPGDRAALMSRMLALTDDALAARMGEEAHRRYWSEPQTLEAHTGNLIAVYRAILTAHRANARAA
jgi:glycosyltransferase involved in cell wall biosynthesis